MAQQSNYLIPLTKCLYVTGNIWASVCPGEAGGLMALAFVHARIRFFLCRKLFYTEGPKILFKCTYGARIFQEESPLHGH